MTFINRLTELLNEKYVTTFDVKQFGKDIIFEIYDDPTSRDIRDIKKDAEYSIRGAVDNKGKIYVWDGDVLHQTAGYKLDKKWEVMFMWGFKESPNQVSFWMDMDIDDAVNYIENKIWPKIENLFKSVDHLFVISLIDRSEEMITVG